MNSSAAKVCAIAGGSGAGKTTLAMKLLHQLGDRGSHLTIDWYYRDHSHLSPAERAAVNFDHPDSLDVALFVDDLKTIRSGQPVLAPVYDFATHTRTTGEVKVEARAVIVTEGIHLLGLEAVRTHCDVLVFIDVSAEIRLARRLERDVVERGRTHESVMEQWEATVAPMHDHFIQPSMAFADVVVGVDDDLDQVAKQLVDELDAMR